MSENEKLSPEEGRELVAKLRKLALSPEDVPLGARIGAGVLSFLLNYPSVQSLATTKDAPAKDEKTE